MRTFNRLTLSLSRGTSQIELYVCVYFYYLGCITERGVGWELYGYDRCSVLVITGIFKFQLYIQLSDGKDAVRERVLAWAFLFGSDKNCYRKLLEDLENAYTQGNDTYPTSLQQAYTLLLGALETRH
jgi:hypothetical protein